MCGCPLCGCVSGVNTSGSRDDAPGGWMLAPRALRCREARSCLALVVVAVLCFNVVGGSLRNLPMTREMSSATSCERGVRLTKCDGRWRRRKAALSAPHVTSWNPWAYIQRPPYSIMIRLYYILRADEVPHVICGHLSYYM